MTVKSNFKLDDRIKSMDDVQTPLQYDNNFIGEKGYFTDNFLDLKDLDRWCFLNTLSEINTTIGMGDEIFRSQYDIDNDTRGSRFFVPERLLKPVEKKYRPFSLEEFLKLFDLGKFHSIRIKRNPLERLVITCIYTTEENFLYAKLNSSDTGYGLLYFFTDCEYFDGEWKPFGVLVKEKE